MSIEAVSGYKLPLHDHLLRNFFAFLQARALVETSHFKDLPRDLHGLRYPSECMMFCDPLFVSTERASTHALSLDKLLLEVSLCISTGVNLQGSPTRPEVSWAHSLSGKDSAPKISLHLHRISHATSMVMDDVLSKSLQPRMFREWVFRHTTRLYIHYQHNNNFSSSTHNNVKQQLVFQTQMDLNALFTIEAFIMFMFLVPIYVVFFFMIVAARHARNERRLADELRTMAAEEQAHYHRRRREAREREEKRVKEEALLHEAARQVSQPAHDSSDDDEGGLHIFHKNNRPAGYMVTAGFLPAKGRKHN
ncbi:hypothetical protein KCU71_g101, partial [Aureobasidium melanogenum]